jgi:two-component system KDP operon response regulator KdpE
MVERAGNAGFAGIVMDASVVDPRTRILVMTGGVELTRLVRSVLEPTGCMVASDQVFTASAKADGPFDVVMVDLPGLDLDRLREAKRTYSDAHLIAICGVYREADCIAVLDLDADYLPRPFRPRDLAARVRVAELRRFNATGRRRYYRCGSFVIDLFDRKVAVGFKPIALAPSELGVLTILASSAGRVATFGRILARLGRADSPSGRRALRASVFRLQRRIERDPRRPDLLLTEAGIGYRLAAETERELSLEASTPHRKGSEDASL